LDRGNADVDFGESRSLLKNPSTPLPSTLQGLKNPAPLAGTGHNGFGSVDALREEIEGRHPRVSRGSATSTALILTQ
jgi:hypothetical protein